MPCAGRRVSSVPAAAAAKPGPHLNYYLDEFTFRFNRRTSGFRGKLFYRLIQQAVQVEPHPYQTLVHPQG